MFDTTIERKRKTWQRLAIVGFVASVCFGLISHFSTSAAATLRKGHPLPGLAVVDADGGESTLDVEAAGFREILVVTPSCDECTDHLVDLVLAAQDGKGWAEEEIEITLFLLIRSDLMPRAEFMPAFNRTVELGGRSVTMTAEEAQKLGIFDVPVVIEMDTEGQVTAIRYLELQR